MLWDSEARLPGIIAELVQGVERVSWARPQALWLLLLVPLWTAWRWHMLRRQQGQLALLGVRRAGEGLPPEGAKGNNRGWLLVEALLCGMLITGLAGPRWGNSAEGAVAVGRDLIVVLDLSRSMQADDMADRVARTRWQAAQQAALQLVDAMQTNGGHRLGIVLFAARPLLLAPLTTDYDFLRSLLEEVDGNHPPAEVRPAPSDTVSGTRIGRALQAAVAAHDRRFPGYQDILLLSDGDDPGGDDEWQGGVAAARAADIPVHTVGLGDPQTPAVLVIADQLVQTRLDENVLRTIAERTGGQYVPAHRQIPPLGDFFRQYLEPLPQRAVSDEALPVPQERYPWAIVPAVLIAILLWCRGR
ncbi:MAG: VWA domain-containing protein [Gemmataceae bacterium]|nr:VWA domain-containing protein [Gemmataceae bacterium]MCS7270183.1 VWA domain-containing protein [Gemmataceae bacterium]MDW8243193.1 VWA domain-containing protein [Thermogemmata sp.]